VAGANREWIEGLVGIGATAMLLYAAFWLNARSNTRKWMGEIREKMRDTLVKKERVGLGLFVISFSSMLRESVETAIFLQGLAIDSASATAWGAVAGIAALLVLVFLMGRFGLKLPLKLLFDLSTWVLFATAVVMLGKAVHALQEVGVVPLRPVPFVRVDLLGVFPDLFSLGAQGLLIAAPFIVRTLRRTPSADSAAAA
jgi:high-affinity iron transporter